MSGIVGIVNFDGEPVDRRLLGRMTKFMAFRGPDAQEIWVNGNVGFGHTLLRTTDEAEHEHQPFTLDARVWIVADARVDARSELISHLQAKGHEELTVYAPDVELILRAYQVWGEGCVEHLLGDFVFAIWDGRQQHLFCARDHMGVKSFYYAHLGQKLIFSNTMDCIRQHPALSDELNDPAIADFLLWGQNQDPATTVFTEIQRLPAAHAQSWSIRETRLRRYWTLPVDELLDYPQAEDYIDRFQELLHISVRERLRTDRLAVFMSGGLDSPSLGAVACELLSARSGKNSVRAFTEVYDRFIPSKEHYYARLVAEHLGIPIRFWALDEDMLAPWGEQDLVRTPEPVFNVFASSLAFKYHREIAAYDRVLFYGEGADNALTCEWRAHLAHLVRKARWGRLLPDLWFHIVGHPRIPFIGRISSYLQGYRTLRFPVWVSRGLVSRLRLTEKWEGSRCGNSVQHVRSKSYRSMSSLLWQDLFNDFAVAGSRTASEVRYPYLDIRLIRFLLAVPPIPWCCNKTLVRRAFASMLPEEVIRRPKSPLARDPYHERARRLGMPQFPGTKRFLEYVNPSLIPSNVGVDVEDFRQNMFAVSLAFWLDTWESGRGAISEAGYRERAGTPLAVA